MTHFKEEINFQGDKYRESIILEVIEKKPGIHHNALKKLVSKHMATKTFDHTVHRLIERNVLEVIPYGDNKKHYALPEAELPDEDNVRKAEYHRYKSMDEQVKELKIEYKNFSVQEKTIIAIQYLNSIFYALNGMTLYQSLSDSKIKEFDKLEENYKKIISNIFEIIGKDQHKSIVIPLVLDSIFKISEYEKIHGIKS